MDEALTPDMTPSPRDTPRRNASGDASGSPVTFPRARSSERLNNLPLELTSFIGREREMTEVERLLLSDSRLLTLTGPGGSGKTRLALAVAADVVEGFEDGVWWVELASLSDPKLVPQVVSSTLGVRERPGHQLTTALTDSLRSKQLLLVLDNCEHLIDACARFVNAMMTSSPHLRVLATSREALGVAGEVNWRVPSLSLPDAGQLPSVEDLTRYEAVRLFVERVRSRLPALELAPENAETIVEICRKLEGNPLAIELATARVTVLAVEQIAERLKDPLGLLTAGSRTAVPRHQTLRATLEWSYDLLDEPERKLFGRLSVFAGGWTLEAAEAMGAGASVEAEEVLDLLGKLVDKSLVVAETGPEGVVRYRMLEPVRQYGRERLEESREAGAALSRHADFFLALAEQAAPELKGPQQIPWLKRLDGEQDNLRAAMAWLLERGELEAAARLGWALWLFWWMRGRFTEGRRWMEEALAKGATIPASARAKALFVAGTMADGQADYRAAAVLLEESLGLFRELGDELGAAYALSSAGFAAIGRGLHEEGIALLEEAVDLSLKVGEKWGAAYMLNFLAVVWRNQEDHARARLLAERGLALSREVGDREGISMALYILAVLAQTEGNHERATRLFEEGLKLSTEVGDETNVVYYLEGLAAVAASEGRIPRAARLWGVAEALLEKIEAAAYVYAPDRSLYQSQVSAARARLDEKAFAAAWAEGRAMTPEQAVNYALGETPLSRAGSVPAEVRPRLRIFALGPERVERGEHVLTSSEWSYAKPKELLYYLLSYPSSSREQIGLALWPDATSAQLRSGFHDALHRLRRALGGTEWIVFERGHYAFNRSLDYFFDVEAFESSLAEAQRLQDEDPAQALRHLEQAVELYGGDFLEDLAGGEWASERREELQRMYREALLTLGRLHFTEGRYAEASETYRRVIAHDEFLETAHRELMRCYAALGERGRALRHYRDLLELLDEELGSLPASETTQLYENLRRGEEV